MNKYLAIGNLTHNPECKDVGDTKVCKFSIAINEYYYSNGEKKKNTIFLDIETWSKQAENCTKFLSKGKKVAIEGKLKANSWEKNGQKFNKIYCLADKVHFLASEDSSETSSQKPPTKEFNKIEKKVETEDHEVYDIDDIPF